MAVSSETLASLVKLVYSERFDNSDLVRKSSLLTNMTRKTDFLETEYAFSVKTSRARGRSHTPSFSVTNRQNTDAVQFKVQSKSDYQQINIQGVVARKTTQASNMEQFCNLLETNIDDGIGTANDELARSAFANGTGSRAVVLTYTSGTTCTVSPEDAMLLNVGDVICSSATDGGALRDSGDTITISAVDTATGTITGSAAWSGISGFAAGDYLVVQGDLNLAFHGLGAWNPASASGLGTAWNNVTRSVNPERLAGLRFDTSTYQIHNFLIAASAYATTRPGKGFDGLRFYMHPMDIANLAIAKEDSRWIDSDNEYGIGVESFRVGNAKLVGDPYCPRGRWFGMGAEAMYLKTAGNQPVLENLTGVDMTYNKTTDDYDCTIVIDGNFISERPWGLMNGAVPAA